MDENEFQRILDLYDVTAEELKAEIPNVVFTLTPDEVELMHTIDFDNPQQLTLEQAECFRMLLVRAGSKLYGERIKAELAADQGN